VEVEDLGVGVTEEEVQLEAAVAAAEVCIFFTIFFYLFCRLFMPRCALGPDAHLFSSMIRFLSPVSYCSYLFLD